MHPYSTRFVESFWQRVARHEADGCWPWTGFSTEHYGVVRTNGKTFCTHRVAYELAIGPIPEGAQVCRTCRNGRCCRPEHLFLGTAANMRDYPEPAPVARICETCAGTFFINRYRASIGGGKFCGRRCFAERDRPVAPLFWDRVEPPADPDACWLWRGKRTEKGYGVLIVRGKKIFAHRISFTLAHGAIPAGLSVCHRCDNPPCVSPHHLFAASHQENMRDAQRKGRLPGNFGKMKIGAS